jgi:hypothetical protein
MSLAIIIKNTILVVLIILIGHFMVKNFLLEKRPRLPAHKTEPNKGLGGALIPVKMDITPSPILPENETPIAKPSSEALFGIQGGLDKAKEELLKFIDDEDEDNVERFFGSDTTLGSQPTDNCKPKCQDNMFPLSTTCDPSMQTLQTTNSTNSMQAVLDKPVKANCNLSQNQKSVIMLNEYDNESTMNGGELFGGLSAFDSFDNNFQVYCEN